MSIEFPLEHKRTSFGLLSDPKIPVTVRAQAGERLYRFLLDSGADLSLAPRRLAEAAGLDWERLQEARIIGVEQGSIRARLGRLPLRVATSELTVRCLFVDNPRTPLLLGRADFFDPS